MASHAADRIAEGGPVLDPDPLGRVGAVAGPGLGSVVEEAGVKAAASRGTGLKEDLREGPVQTLIEVIDAQDVAVEEFPLAVGGKDR